jgi:hypothetical protein
MYVHLFQILCLKFIFIFFVEFCITRKRKKFNINYTYRLMKGHIKRTPNISLLHLCIAEEYVFTEYVLSSIRYVKAREPAKIQSEIENYDGIDVISNENYDTLLEHWNNCALNSSVEKIEFECLANIIEENQEEDFVTDNLLSNLDSLKPIK